MAKSKRHKKAHAKWLRKSVAERRRWHIARRARKRRR